MNATLIIISNQQGSKVESELYMLLMKVYLPSIREKFTSDNYYRSCKAIINKVNSHFGWSMDYLHVTAYEQHHDEIVQVMLDNYTIRNNDQLSSKMGHIYGAMKVAGFHGTFQEKGLALKQVPVHPKPLVKNTPCWSDMTETLNQAIKNAAHPGAIVLALCYKHGYVLRCGEIANTCTKDNPKYNYLDTKECIWYIRAALTKNRQDRFFPVTQKFIEDISPYIKSSGFLISKRSGQPYTGNFTLATVGLQGFTVNDVRNSYETMNYNRLGTGIDDETRNNISINVLGHCPAVARAYYTDPIKASDMINKPKIIKKN